MEEADKTGSHIIPHFVIESITNFNKSKGRDKEQSFEISASNSTFYFGRSVSPAKLEELLGRPVDENDIKQNYHHYVRNYIFCSSCETKFSVFESLYQSELSNSIKLNKQLTEEQIKIFSFFWLSVILRCSVTRFGAFELEKGLESEVSKSINIILSSSVKDLRANCINETFTFKLLSFANTKLVDKTRNTVVLIPSNKSPYILFINEYLLIFGYTNLSEIRDILSSIGINTPSNLSDTTLAYLNNDDWEIAISFCFKIIVAQFKQNQIIRFSEAFHLRNYCPPPQSKVEAFLSELILDETVDEVSKYSEARIERLIVKYIQT